MVVRRNWLREEKYFLFGPLPRSDFILGLNSEIQFCAKGIEDFKYGTYSNIISIVLPLGNLSFLDAYQFT